MSQQWQVLELDLISPLRDALFAMQQYKPKYIDVASEVNVQPSRMALRTLGKLVEAQLPRVPAMQSDRREARFLWLDVRVSSDDTSPGSFEQIMEDPLLHQQLFDAVRAPFDHACRRIASYLKLYDDEMDKVQGPGVNLETHPKTSAIVGKIRYEIVQAQSFGIKNLQTVLKELPEEIKNRLTGTGKLVIGIKIALGATAVLAAGAAAVGSIVLTGGAAGIALGAVGFLGGARGLADLFKAISDQVKSMDTVEKRLAGAQKRFKESIASHGSKGTAEAILNSTLKVGAVGYNLFNHGKVASLSDIKEDLDLYEQKLASLIAHTHDLSRKVASRLNEIASLKKKDKLKENRKLLVRKITTPQGKVVDVSLDRSKEQIQLNELLVKIPVKHQQCVAQKQKIAPLRDGVKEVLRTLDKTVLTIGHHKIGMVEMEKWLDLVVNVSFTAAGGAGTGTYWGGGNWGDVAGSVSGLTDVVNETIQAVSNSSSRTE